MTGRDVDRLDSPLQQPGGHIGPVCATSSTAKSNMRFKIFHWHSLKTRVTFFTLAIFLVSLWLLAFYASRVLHKDMQRLLGDQQFSTATFVASDINQEISSRIEALELVAKRITPAMIRNPETLQAMLEDRQAVFSEFNNGLVVADIEGTVIAEYPHLPGRLGANFKERDYIIGPLGDGKVTLGKPVMSKFVHAPTFVIGVPLRDPQGKVIGVLGGVTDLQLPNFLDSITQGRYGKTGGFLLMAPQSRLIVTASDKQRVMEALPALGINPLIDQRVRGQEGTDVFVNPRGVEVLSSAKGVPAAGWIVVVSLPTEEAFAPIRDVEQRLLLATLFLTLLAGSLSWWMVRRQLAPMLATVKALALLSQSSQHPQPLPITRRDEIGELIGGFNHLLSELGQRETFLKQILNTSSVGIFLVDQRGRITQANQRMANMFGCSVETLVGGEYVSCVHPAEREDARQNMLALLASAIPSADVDRIYWRADHTEFWGHLSSKRFIDVDGKEDGLINVISDITERKFAEQTLIENASILTAVIENFPGGLSMFDANLRLTAYNQQFKRLLDFPDSLFEKPDVYLEDLIRYNAQRGDYGPGDIEQQVAAKVERARNIQPHKLGRVRPDGRVLEIRSEPVPSGGFVTIYMDITERKQMEELVRQLAFYDPLTKLPNRRLLNDRLDQAMAASQRSGRYGALMFLDLDNFKALNDTHGHGAGDLLLMEAANRLKKCVREVDTVVRLGGDEFVVMVGDLDVDKAESALQAGSIAEKIRTSLAEPYLLAVKHDGKADAMVEHRCSASIGVVVFVNGEGSQDDFLRWADAAMYQAKDAGSNLIRFHSSNASIDA